jgi:hypothetical protein
MDINRKFGLLTGGACLTICAYKLVFHHPHFIYFAIPGYILLLTALIKPSILNALRILWDKIGALLGTINSYVILTIIFFIIITPIGFLLKLMKNDLLDLAQANNKITYWQQVSVTNNSSLKQQF